MIAPTCSTSPSCTRTRRTSAQVADTRRPLAARRGVRSWSLPRVARLRAPRSRAAAAGAPVECAQRMGKLQPQGEIRLNWRLIQLPPALADYVVAHEVAHLVELNHSPRFWALVEALMPGHAALRRELDDWTALLAA